ncbi:cobalamin biosynthesis protein [Nocardioides marmoriginsengisoli]|uniref:Cobalamin biosynthesis protein CobD n=1 Tax=Nocardioides marmoriginsengisoli TaxID=661483 RepID=A0A3N0CBT7_9ACTN|nr:cobalamin biosynthesis protein [Nocardioides marmoriginsengisoli]RNL60769.1 cobalamin biosynthesis protein [Nocardioides marmoriginsengisoli]
MRSRAAGLVLGFAADRLLGDPRRFHPVAGFGQVAARLEQRLYADSRARGAAYWLVLVGGTTAAGIAVERASRHRPVPHALLTAAATWAVLGARSLDREAAAVESLLADDLPAARQRLTHLVGRDTRSLDEAGVARAVVESVAENTSDAVVSSLVLGGLFGIPGLLGHRAANTLDAMVGHRSVRYTRFGWASARADDVLNLPGSRLTAALAVALADDRPAAVAAWRRDAAAHPSPNAGPIEAAFAGALGIRLGGTNVYGDQVEDRARLGDGRPATTRDIGRARDLARRIDLAALVLVTVVAWRRSR